MLNEVALNPFIGFRIYQYVFQSRLEKYLLPLKELSLEYPTLYTLQRFILA